MKGFIGFIGCIGLIGCGTKALEAIEDPFAWNSSKS
jgi:hypothetical protein